MPSFFPIQTGFHAGEISGRGRGRLDLPLYKFGLAYCESFEPMAQGSLRMRSGSEHVAALTGDNRTRLIQFRMVNGNDYLVELLHQKMRLYAVDGAAINAEAVNRSSLLVNGDFSMAYGAGWEEWADSRNPWHDADGLNPSGFNAPGAANWPHGPADHCQFGTGFLARAIRQQITVVRDSSLDISIKIIDRPLHPGGGGLGENLKVDICTVAPNPGDVGDIFHAVEYPDVRTHEFNVPNVPAGTYYVMISTDYSGGICFNADDMTVYANALVPFYDIDTPWTADEVRGVQLASETGADRTIFVHPGHAPWTLNYEGPGAWSFAEILFANQPDEWVAGNYPGVIEIHDGRAYYSGVPSAKNRWWASRSGVLFDLNTATGPGSPATPLPSDGMDYKAATKGAIRWIQGNKKILVGTDLSEHSITGSKETPMPGDVYVRRESGFGSCANIQAVDAGDYALYASGDRRKIRAIAYDFQVSGWKSKDVTFFAEHMTLGKLKELHHVFAPEGCLIGLLEDGTFIVATFEPDENVIAFWRLPLASGLVRSAAVSRGDDGAFLWAAVERGGVMFLERIPLTDPAARFFLDAAVEATADANGDVAVTHLTGAVRVLSEGAFVGDFNVVGGVLALGAEYANADVVVGLPFRAKAVTLPLEGGNPGGTSQGFKVHYTDITARLNNSAPPLLNGARAGKGRPFATPLDTVEELVTADLGVSSMKVEEGGVITIEQDLPFRTEICALYAQAHVSKI